MTVPARNVSGEVIADRYELERLVGAGGMSNVYKAKDQLLERNVALKVLLTPDGNAKVTDFGIARSLDVEHGVTQTGTVLGTSNYLSPEQANGQPTTPATDVYSLGVVLYELLTGDVPFPGENFVAIALKHVNEPPPNLLDVRKDVPLRVAAAVDRALEKDPQHRFGSMDEFADELEACLAGLDAPEEHLDATVVTRPSHATTRHRKRVSRWAIASVGLG